MALRRSMAESDEANWTPRMDSEEEGIFDDSDSIFSNELQDTSNPKPITYAEDNLPDVPIEDQKKFLAQSMRKTLVAMDSPRGILVARAIRNTQNGRVKHLEAFRPPTKAEIQELSTRGVKVNTDIGQVAMADMSPEAKGVLGIGLIGTVGVIGLGGLTTYLVYKYFKDRK